MTGLPPLDAEWLEADGLGGFASGTVGGERTRRYHALLLAATTPPTGRFVLVNGLETGFQDAETRVALSTQRYAGDVVHPDGASRLVDFEREPWPRWRFALGDGRHVVQEIFVAHGAAVVVVAWRLEGGGGGMLRARPLLSGRDPHGLMHENSAFRFDAALDGERVSFSPYSGVPGVHALSNGRYQHAPDWYRRFLYTQERARGLDCEEDLGTPGCFEFDLGRGEAVLLLAAEGSEGMVRPARASPEAVLGLLRDSERRRRQRFATPLERAADAYLVRRGGGRSIIAGYPWFVDWGRDSFIALRGLCLATGRLDAARDILLEWSASVSEGMLPNRFPDAGDQPEFNSVDASLWYVVAVHDFLATAARDRRRVSDPDRHALGQAVLAILQGYTRGTRYGIRADADGLLAAGVPGVQLTWMDAKVGDWVVTPRTGKPVEVQALWLNALRIGSTLDERYGDLLARACAAFEARFWNAERGFLFDVVDVGHEPGKNDASLRPNQILAVGGLPFPPLAGARARCVVEAVERALWTPLGLRSLAAGEAGYHPRYQGGVAERDGAYHQGTVWPWLAGPFVDAWLRVHGDTPERRTEARERFLAPLRRHLEQAGLGHVSEIADAEAPFSPRGCPFQAWSLGELLRIEDRLAVPRAAVPRGGLPSL